MDNIAISRVLSCAPTQNHRADLEHGSEDYFVKPHNPLKPDIKNSRQVIGRAARSGPYQTAHAKGSMIRYMAPRTNTSRVLPRPAGFSLIELMIVVLVLAIAAALAVPMLGNTAPNKLKGAASMLAADLAYAQVESIAHGDDRRLLVFDNPSDTYHIAAASDPATPITHPITKLPYLIDYGSGTAESLVGVTINSYSLNGDDRLGFDIYGALDQPTDATITLGCDGLTVTVTADANTGETVIGGIN